MYLYTLYGHEDNIVLAHQRKFTDEQFDKMCKEAPLDCDENASYYDSGNIKEYLIEKYGFESVEYVAGFNFDDDVE